MIEWVEHYVGRSSTASLRLHAKDLKLANFDNFRELLGVCLRNQNFIDSADSHKMIRRQVCRLLCLLSRIEQTLVAYCSRCRCGGRHCRTLWRERKANASVGMMTIFHQRQMRSSRETLLCRVYETSERDGTRKWKSIYRAANVYSIWVDIDSPLDAFANIYTHFSGGLNSIRIIIKDSRVLHSSPLGIISLRCVVWHLCRYSSVRTGSHLFDYLALVGRRTRVWGGAIGRVTVLKFIYALLLLLLSSLYMFYVFAHVSTDSVGRTATLRVVRLLSLSDYILLKIFESSRLSVKNLKHSGGLSVWFNYEMSWRRAH